MRRLLIAGNWKMNKLRAEAQQFVQEFLPLVSGIKEVETVICPPYTSLEVLEPALASSGVLLGAQDLSWEEKGAFTGEVSAQMLAEAGCRYAIVGHSERRHIMGETDALVNRKMAAAKNGALIPILCVGETLREREEQRAKEVVSEQLRQAFKGLEFAPGQMVIAYEPVWAIGTGVNATAADAQEMCHFIRQSIADLYDQALAERLRILYGGSVTGDNIANFIAQSDIDGALVGGASLQAASFATIVRMAEDEE